MKNSNTFRHLIKVAGKILFVIGLVLNILMIFFGFWPSFIYVLIMLGGAGMFSFNKDVAFKNISINDIKEKAKAAINADTTFLVVRTVFLTVFGLTATVVIFLWFSQDYFKRRDTVTDGQEIITAINSYYKQKNKFPDSLSVIISNNPMRKSWNKDGWNNPYHYSSSKNGTSFSLISSGKDGKFNTNDDIVLSTKNDTQ